MSDDTQACADHEFWCVTYTRTSAAGRMKAVVAAVREAAPAPQ
ncbi:hypothetical protein ACQP2E_33720 [Actinoplanes sp. CA-015351]